MHFKIYGFPCSNLDIPQNFQATKKLKALPELDDDDFDFDDDSNDDDEESDVDEDFDPDKIVVPGN